MLESGSGSTTYNNDHLSRSSLKHPMKMGSEGPYMVKEAVEDTVENFELEFASWTKEMKDNRCDAKQYVECHESTFHRGAYDYKLDFSVVRNKYAREAPI